jgi:UDP-2-acetamido-2,6-beta-L-arabino-hexul-4-ose reductase
MEKITPILITGAQGFVGKNLTAHLTALGYHQLRLVDRQTPEALIRQYVQEAGFIFHLAGENRPSDPSAFLIGNVDSLKLILSELENRKTPAPIVLASSLQAILDNPYGQSKRLAEETLIQFAKPRAYPYVIYRFSNIFGKWSKPNYNSVVATFCHHIARQIPIQIHDPAKKISLIYIDDVIDELIRIMEGRVTTVDGMLRVLPEYERTVGDLAKWIQQFHEHRERFFITDQQDPFIKRLYATYISFLEPKALCYPAVRKEDSRGSFTELLKTATLGQVSVNITKPGITKGNHYHHTKTEKFITVSGKGIIRFRAVGTKEIIEIPVSSQPIQIVDIPPGYVHSLVNAGTEDLITIMWVSEPFDPLHPDTYPMEVGT